MNIKDIRFVVTYTVALSELEVPENVYEQLVEAYEENEIIEIDGSSYFADALDWLTTNISESDSCDWSVEIDELITND
jgi:hypothetical protein